MEKLIEKLVAEYKADRITWHDIQDIVEAEVMKKDSKGMVTDPSIIFNRLSKVNTILGKIENKLKEVK